MQVACAVTGFLASPVVGQYLHSEKYVDRDFFTKWDFFNIDDPSHGHVSYVDYPTAVSFNLVGANDDEVFMSADTNSMVQPGGEGRKSLRLQSVKTYNSGLFIIHVKHVPTGCGVWPAFWLYGEGPGAQWPAWGEYDIIEGVNKANIVRTALHTSAGCDQSGVVPGQDFSSVFTQGMSKAADNCDIKADGQYKNQGCSQDGPPGSIGDELNTAGGGTWAGEWDPIGKRIRTWFWPDGTEPLDIVAKIPDPDGWGKPYSFFSLEDWACPTSHFQNMRMVFSLDLGGDLAESHFQKSCPDLASRMSCADLIQYHPEELKQAFWSIKALDVYQWRPLPPPGAEFDASTATPTTEAPLSFAQVGATAGAGGSAGLPPGADLSSPAALRHEAMDRSLPAPTVPPEMSKVSISDRDRPSFGFMQARGDTSIPPFVARAAAWMGSAIAGATALVLLLVIIRVASGSRQSESDRQVVMHLNDSDSCSSCRTQSGLD